MHKLGGFKLSGLAKQTAEEPGSDQKEPESHQQHWHAAEMQDDD